MDGSLSKVPQSGVDTTVHWKEQKKILPIAKIWKIMRSEQDDSMLLQQLLLNRQQDSAEVVAETDALEQATPKFMIASESPVIMIKAVEMIIQDIAVRSYVITDQKRRKTIRKSDIIAACQDCDLFAFLNDILSQSSSS